MTPMPQCTSIAETLSVMTSGEPAWANRIVTMSLNEQADAWVAVYPVTRNELPYFDFAYRHEAPPQDVLARLLGHHNRCEVIDWSPGRLASIQVKSVSVSQLAEIIAEVAREVFGMSQITVSASYEDILPA